jgi:hypothetical protein
MPIEISFQAKLQLNDDVAAMLAVHERLIDVGTAALGRVAAAGEYRYAIALLAGQALASAQALQVLCVAGRANQARPTARSMIETLINAYFIARNPQRAISFWTYRPIPLAKVAEARFRVFGITEELDEIRAQASDARAKLLPHKHWADPVDVRSRAEQCGMGDVYDLYYPEASAFSHGDSSMWNALSSDDGRVIRLGPSPEGIEEVLGPAMSAGFALLFLVADVFDDAGLRQELGRLGAELPRSTKRIDLRAQFEHVRKVRPRANADEG